MATKQTLKELKSSPKLSAKKPPSLKVASQKPVIKKEDSVQSALKKNLKTATTAQPAVKGSVPVKGAPLASKSTTSSVKKATEHTTKADKAPVKGSGVPAKASSTKETVAKSTVSAKTASDKKNPSSRVVAQKSEEVPLADVNATPQKNGAKQVIVPSKPAINPKPQSEKKVETVKSNKPFVMPKTTTDKVVDYDPDFTKSVLDVPSQPASLPTMRYSDMELNEFKELINKKLDAAKKELVYLQGLITRKDEMGGDESDNRYMTMEDGSMSMEREQLSQMASRQITFIDHLEKAIMRIENKTYGICRVTGKLIDKARLRAVPHATLSMEAKLGIVK